MRSRNPRDSRLDPDLVDADVLRAKLHDLEIPGFEVTFEPHEADALGAFREDALSEDAAMDAACDLGWEVDHG